MKHLDAGFKKVKRNQFARKYFSIPVILFLGWITIGNIIEQNYGLADLNRITGPIDRLITTSKQFNKSGKEKELRIFLKNSPGYFRLTNNFDYQKIPYQISRGDAITIFYRKKNQLKWGFGRQADIYHLQHNGHVLFDLRKRQESSFKITIATGTLILIGLFIFYAPKTAAPITALNRMAGNIGEQRKGL